MPIQSIITRSGAIADIQYRRIEERIEFLIHQFGLFHPDSSHHINAIFGAIMGKLSLINVDQISTTEIDMISIDIACTYGMQYPDGFRLATFIYMDNLHKNFKYDSGQSFRGYIKRAQNLYDPSTQTINHLFTPAQIDFMNRNIDELENIIDYDADFNFPIDGCKVLGGNYLKKKYVGTEKKTIIESPQDMFMRTAIQLYQPDLSAIKHCYKLLSSGAIMMATPTLLRAWTRSATLTSCNMATVLDSIESIYYRNYQIAKISRGGGGIGLDLTPLRTMGSYIRTTNGMSCGPMKFCEIYEKTAQLVNQGGDRPGSVAIYLALWHINVEELISCRSEFVDQSHYKKNATIFPGVFTYSLFVERIRNNQTWTLFCPTIAPKLIGASGQEFVDAYLAYERQWAHRPDDNCIRRVSAQSLNQRMVDSRIKTGMPYNIDWDIARETHNQRYQMNDNAFCLLYNLCTEISLACDPTKNEITTCNLGTVCVNHAVNYDKSVDKFDWPTARDKPLFNRIRRTPTIEKWVKYFTKSHIIPCNPAYKIGTYVDLTIIAESAYHAARAVNRIIDTTDYVDEGCRIPAFRERPIGIGQQGFGDLLTMLGYAFDDPEVTIINQLVQGTIFYFGWLASIDLARENGKPFDSYEGSPMSRGMLHNDILRETISQPFFKDRNQAQIIDYCNSLDDWFDWVTLKTEMRAHGVYNNHITSMQPSESSAKVHGNSEMAEPRKAPLYYIKNDKVITCVVSELFISALNACKYNTPTILAAVEGNQGSIQSCEELPIEFRRLFKTIYEFDPTIFIIRAAEREPFIDLAQSTNVYVPSNHTKYAIAADSLAYKLALRTRSYYVRVKPSQSKISGETGCLMCQ